MSTLVAHTGELLGLARANAIAAEARHAVADMPAEQWARVLAFAASAAVIDTGKAKVAGVIALGGMIGERAKTAVAEIRDVGIGQAVRGYSTWTRSATGEQYRAVRRLWADWQTLDAGERRELVADALVAGVTAYLVAGGPDLEGGLPDLDLLFGVGMHRNPFSHTFLVALGAEMSIRFVAAALAQLHERLPDDHDPMWDTLKATFERRYEAAIVGVWFGTALHLLKDAGLPFQPIKPMTGLPMTLSMAGHQMLLAGNAVAAAGTGLAHAVGLKKKYVRMRDEA